MYIQCGFIPSVGRRFSSNVSLILGVGKVALNRENLFHM